MDWMFWRGRSGLCHWSICWGKDPLIDGMGNPIKEYLITDKNLNEIFRTSNCFIDIEETHISNFRIDPEELNEAIGYKDGDKLFLVDGERLINLRTKLACRVW